ncbi:MAG: hypothetical protein V7638_4648 [Acidobacteriota bacterium]|jgi:hypothetical protein
MSLDDLTKAIVASNLTTAFHVEFASSRALQGSPVDPDIPKERHLTSHSLFGAEQEEIKIKPQSGNSRSFDD